MCIVNVYTEYSFYVLFDILFFLLLGGKVTERGRGGRRAGEGERERDRGGEGEEGRAVLREAA